MGEGIGDGGEFEGEVVGSEFLGKGAGAREESFLGEVAEGEFEGKGGGGKEGGTAEDLADGAGEIGIGYGIWGDEVDGAGDWIFEAEDDGGDFVVEVNPWHPLFSVSEFSADSELKDRAHAIPGAAVGSEDDAGAEEGDAGGWRGGGGGFPILAELGEEAIAGGVGFGENLVATMSVVADAGGVEEGLDR